MPADDRIKHIVVLMLENRSFDHLFGLFNIPDMDGTAPGKFSNQDHFGRAIPVDKGALYAGQLDIDPPHEFENVDLQLFGEPRASTPNMSGFALSYQRAGGAPANVLRSFEPSQLPTLSSLARNYLVCDRWFSSVPGPTNPNRAFAHFGTSFGRVDCGVIWTGHGAGIYGRLADAGRTARLYYYSRSSGTIGMSFLPPNLVGLFGDFKDDCEHGTLPDYSFIEPPYNDDDDTGRLASDMHPDHDVKAGDEFVRDVYEAIRSNDEVWRSTLLLIVWDEHGGLYDHVKPPPLGYRDSFESLKPPFKFDRLGVRVPAIVVSPYVEPGVNHTQFEHASIPATATEQFIGDPATHAPFPREQHANTFLKLLQPAGFAPRMDTPDFDRAVEKADTLHPFIGVAHPDAPANQLQMLQVHEAFHALVAQDPFKASAFAPTHVQTQKQAADYSKRVLDILHAPPVAAAPSTDAQGDK